MAPIIFLTHHTPSLYPYMYFVYILYSKSIDRYYIGQTSDLEKRLERHVTDKDHYTSQITNWKIVYQEEYETRGFAMLREKKLKSYRNRRYIEWIIRNSTYQGSNKVA